MCVTRTPQTHKHVPRTLPGAPARRRVCLVGAYLASIRDASARPAVEDRAQLARSRGTRLAIAPPKMLVRRLAAGEVGECVGGAPGGGGARDGGGDGRVSRAQGPRVGVSFLWVFRDVVFQDVRFHDTSFKTPHPYQGQ